MKRRSTAMLSPRILLSAAASLALSACGPPTLGVTPAAIQGGTNDTQHLFAVGILTTFPQGTALCSGALLAPNLVATARHCVSPLPGMGVIACPDTKFTTIASPADMVVSTDPDLRTATTSVGVSKIVIPSGADQTSVCGNDIALLILSKPITLPAYVTPVLSPPMTDHAVYAATITAIGYGLSSATDSMGTSAGVRRIRKGIALTCIPNDSTFPGCYPSRSFPMTQAEFLSGNATCEGDSGSDAYEQSSFDAGKWFGFGVLSRGSSQGSTCVGGIYTRFDAWAQLISDTAKQAAMMGGYDVPSWADPSSVDDGGTGPTDASTTDAADAGDAAKDATGDATGTRDGGADAVATRDAVAGETASDGAGSDGARDAVVPPAMDGAAADRVPADSGAAPDAGAPFDAGPSVDARSDASVEDALGDRGPPSTAFDGSPGGEPKLPHDGGADAVISIPSIDADSSGGAATSASPAGCSCETAGSGGRGSPWGLLLLAAGAVIATRRRAPGRRTIDHDA